MNVYGKQYVIETVMMEQRSEGILAACAAIVTVDDNGAGPYLIIEGRNLDPAREAGEANHSFCLCDDSDIDEFAAALKQILKQARTE